MTISVVFLLFPESNSHGQPLVLYFIIHKSFSANLFANTLVILWRPFCDWDNTKLFHTLPSSCPPPPPPDRTCHLHVWQSQSVRASVGVSKCLRLLLNSGDKSIRIEVEIINEDPAVARKASLVSQFRIVGQSVAGGGWLWEKEVDGWNNSI